MRDRIYKIIIFVMRQTAYAEGFNDQSGKVIKERFPVLESYDMTLEASVTKMMWALGQTRDMEKFKELFYTTINHDLLFL